MTPRNRRWMAGLIAATCLALSGRAGAGPYVDVMQPCDCPPTHYSALHVLTPVLYRWAAWCQGPSRYTFACIQNPEIAPSYYIAPYHCPALHPLQYADNNYLGLGSPSPCSTYRPQTHQTKPPTPAAPQMLPSPREEPKK